MNPPQILQIIDSNIYGGSQKVAFELSKRLESKNLGFSFLLLNRYDKEHQMQRFLREKDIPYIEVSFINLRRLPSYTVSRSIEIVIVLFFLLVALFRFKVNIVHIHIFQLFYIVPIIRLLKFFNIPLIWTIHGEVNYSKKSTTKIFDLINKKEKFKKNVKIIKVADNINQNLWKEIANNDINSYVITNGVDLKTFSFSNTARKEIRNELKLTQEDILIGFVGRLEKEKGVDILINAFFQLSNIANLKLLIIGDGSLFNNYKHKVDQIGIDKCVIFAGGKKNLSEWLSALDIFIQPSRAEGLSLATIEALSVGLPIIATDVGGTKELLHGGKSGILVPKESSEAISEAIKSLVDNSEMRKTLSEESIDQAQNFSTEKMVKAYLDIYQSFL